MEQFDEFDRDAVVQQMRDAAATLHRLLGSAADIDLRRCSNGTRWSNEQLLFHMVFGFVIVRALLVLVRGFGRLPPPISRRFAALLNAATTPFDWINYWGSVLGARLFDHGRMGRKLDRVTAALGRSLQRETPADLARAMSYPTRWDPFFMPSMTLADVYRYPSQHFEFHRQQLSLAG